MDNQRNENGQFAPGHQGFKPIGAVSRKKNYDLECLKEIFDIIIPNVERDLRNAGAAARLKTMLDISKILTANRKLKKKPKTNRQSPPNTKPTDQHTDI